MSRKRAAVVMAVLTLGPGAAGARASLIWDGDASQGTGVFSAIGTGNCIGEGSSSLTAVSDSTHGTVWRYYKPSDSNRCENHGIKVSGSEYKFAEGGTYYLGWYYKLSSTANNNANFQWKSYGTGHNQNFPFVIKNVDGNVKFMYTQPGGGSTFIWSHSIAANVWNHVAIGIHVTNTTANGWAELWYNGVKQTFTNGSQRYTGRTLDDGLHNCPKWGVYGGMGSTWTNWVDGLKVGTAYSDVAMSGGGTPTPTPGPTPTPCSGCTFSGYYKVLARHSGKAMTVQSASTSNGANVFQWTYGGSATNDEWEVRGIGSGYYRVINRNSGKDLTVESASTSDGANIFQYTYGGSATNDEWAIVDVGSGYFRITNRNSGKSAEVAAGGTGDGANVDQRSYSGATYQQFQLVSVP